MRKGFNVSPDPLNEKKIHTMNKSIRWFEFSTMWGTVLSYDSVRLLFRFNHILNIKVNFNPYAVIVFKISKVFILLLLHGLFGGFSLKL